MDISSDVVRFPKLERRTVSSLGYSGVYAPATTKKQLKVTIIAYLESLEGGADEREPPYHLTRTKRISDICQSLSHPNIVRFYGTCKFSHPNYSVSTALVFEHSSNGDLGTYITKTGTRSNRIFLMTEVAKGISYLHSENYAHGDINPKTILVRDNGIPVVSDFGRSRAVGSSGQTTEASGTRRYTAPEAWMSKGTRGLAPPADVYSFGMTALFALSGKVPYYNTSNDVAAQRTIQRGTPPSRQMYGEIADNVWSVIEVCWRADAASRPFIKEVLDQLSLFL